MAKASAIARSTARRYPRELMQSLLKRGEVPVRDAASPGPGWAEAQASPLAAAWIGHATVLLRIGGLWAITDPVFSRRIGVQVGPFTMGVERLASPHLDFEHLPPIDLILISHAHFDHLDKPSLRRLVRDTTTVITSRKTSRLIPRGFGEVRELHWEESTRIGNITISAMRPRHWGARTAWDRHRGYNAYVLDSTNGVGTANTRVLYAGDTAHTENFADVGGADLSVFGIGAYDPWIHAHATPEQVWEMHEQAEAKYLLPVHHSTFKLSDEPISEPMERLLTAAGDQAHRVVKSAAGRLWVP